MNQFFGRVSNAFLSSRWATGWLKINIGGAVDNANGKGATGMVARDHDGAFLSARHIGYVGVTDPLSLELLACRDAMLFAKEKGYQSIIIETDCFNAKTYGKQGKWIDQLATKCYRRCKKRY